jgi:hypothetical protein
MTKFLMIKIVLFCRLFIDVPLRSVCGHLFSGWRIETCLQRSVHDWRLRRGIFFPHMGGRIIFGLVLLQLLRRFTIARNDMYFAFYLEPEFLDSYVHLVMQRPGVIA